MARPREPPTAEEVYEAMVPCTSYVVADLRVRFEAEYGPAHNTIRNRLVELVESGCIERTTHENGTVTYRRPKTE